MRIYTRTGDNGTTGLFGGARVDKCSPRIDAYGIVDELNASIGLALADLHAKEPLSSQLLRVQRTLFSVGSDLATPLGGKGTIERLKSLHTEALEQWIDSLEEKLSVLTQFILPGGCLAACALHTARTICRRAERSIAALMKHEQINREILPYINRLSDYLFVAARTANKIEGIEDTLVVIPRSIEEERKN